MVLFLPHSRTFREQLVGAAHGSLPCGLVLLEWGLPRPAHLASEVGGDAGLPEHEEFWDPLNLLPWVPLQVCTIYLLSHVCCSLLFFVFKSYSF